jgi:hypothetical protein
MVPSFLEVILLSFLLRNDEVTNVVPGYCTL